MLRLAVRVDRSSAELVLAELLELAPGGVEEVEYDEDTIEYAVYGAPGELPLLPDLQAAAGEAGGTIVSVSTTEVADDWAERWRDFHQPLVIGDALCVRPPWEPAIAGVGIDVVIDPGQAFGTGSHASTRMCLELLLELAASEAPAGPLLDVGTGSGVLAIAAAMLGFTPVLGLDHEQESVQASAENALVNDVRIEVRRFDLRSQELPWLGQEGDLVMLANLLRPLLLELASTMSTAPAHLVASGLLREEADEVAAEFSARLGMSERQRRASGEWAAIWLAAG
jgi:ribosomal protein L11 methyltransferase